MPEQTEDPARAAALDALRRAAVVTYGEERAAEAPFQSAVDAAATAVWRVMAEPLDPADEEPFTRV